MDKITDFINRRFHNAKQSDANWLNGNCYYFALILKDRFNGEIYYDVINGHFLTLINNTLYDATGIVHKLTEENILKLNQSSLFHSIKLTNDLIIVNWQYFHYYDQLQKQRIDECCIN